MESQTENQTRTSPKVLGIILCYAIVFFIMTFVLRNTVAASTSYGPLPYTEPQSRETNPISTEEYLREFHRDPKKVMNTPLSRFDQSGKIISRPVSPFELYGISTEEMLEARDQSREKVCEASGIDCRANVLPKPQNKPGRWAAMDDRNRITRILSEKDVIRNLLTMERENLLVAALVEPPWTDSYWPMNRGLTGRRWNDKNFPDSSDWIVNYNYIQENSGGWFLSIDKLSPAEKYDLLIGDAGKTLTNVSWQKGKYHHDLRGHVPGWQGLCHGWAPAAYMAPNPKQSVSLPAASGQMITFYPSDIKALASLAWGEAMPPINSLGVRCNVKNPKEDEYGRVIDPNCFDLNPGAWHMTIVSHLGRQKRGFVFDSTFDHQVWNYPIYAYSYRYFNPQTLSNSSRMASAMIRREDFTIDKFKSYRNPGAAYVVGIAMDVQYAVPTAPSVNPEFNPLLQTIRYVYDLELDQQGNIIGGEWYSNFHPDFIWSLPPGSKPLANIEKQNPGLSWQGGPIPQNVRDAAQQAASSQQPLYTIVETLLRMSQGSLPPGTTEGQ